MLAWICDHLDKPLLWESDFGVAANARARDMLQRQAPESLAACLQDLLGDRVSEEAIQRALSSARAGTPSALRGGRNANVLCIPDAPGRVAVILDGLQPIQSALRPTAPHPSPIVMDDVAGVSHELANTLNAIAGWARVARTGERVPEALSLIERSAESAWATARQWLAGLSGRERAELTGTTDLSALVAEAAALISPQASANGVRVHTAVEPTLYARGDRGALWSVLWNLATNAVEAMPSGGSLTLSLEGDADSVYLVVEDAGQGMSGDVQAHIFDPYFTTKPEGTGIGLPFVKRIIDQLGGTIVCQSEPGHGSRFEVRLPAASKPLTKRIRRDAKRVSGVFMTEPLIGHYLVVDDDPVLRELIRTALQMRGAKVTAVSTAEEALKLREQFTGAVVDLLLADRRGDLLLAELRARGTADWAIIITGTELPEDMPAAGAPDVLLRKPFDLEALFESLVDFEKNSARSAMPATSA